MPNDCWSTVTIKGTEDDLNNIYDKHLKEFKLINKSEFALKVRIWSAWSPDEKLLNLIKNEFPNVWIKNEWSEEGGVSGIWIYNDCVDLDDKKVKQFTWNDMCIEEYAHCFHSS